MSKKVLDVGNCNPDHSSLTYLLESNFDVEVQRTHGLQDTLKVISKEAFDLVLVNRVMDRDGSSGLEIIQRIKAEPATTSIPVMMITNYPQHQQSAVEVGAEYGFGKAELRDATTLQMLQKFLTY